MRLMADSKEAMATATEMATQIGKDTTLGHARATLNLMTTCLHEAAAAKTQDAPEVPPLKTQIRRVGPIVAAKQEVHDSTVAPVNGKMTVEHLRGPVTQRMLTARRRAEDIEAWGGPEARALEARLLYVEEMAAAKIACREGMKHRVDPMMTSSELRAVVNKEHAPRLRRAEKAGVADSPEHANLLERMKWATGMANSKDEMRRVMAAVVDANTDLAVARAASMNLSQAIQNARRVRLECTPQFERCEKRCGEVNYIYSLKHAVHVAAQGGDPRMSIADLRGRVTLEMKAARSAAMQGGAYGGDVERELENRLVVVRNMANGKAMAQANLAARISAGCSIDQLDGERSRLSRVRYEVESMHAAGSQEHEALCSFIGEIGRWIDIKRNAQETLGNAKSALDLPIRGQVAFLAHHTISGGCTRGNVVRVIDAYNVVVHPVNWWGNEKEEQEFTGRDAEGNEQYRSVSIEETVPLRLCMQGSIEKVKKLRTKVASAIARCEGIGAKGEVSELRYVSQTLDQGRSGPLRAPRGGFENAAWNIFQSGNSREVRAYEEQAAAAAEIDRKAEQMARQRTEAEADRRRQEAADAKSRKRAAEAESRAADTERKKEEYREKKAQEAAAAAGVAGAATAGGAGGSAVWGAVKAAGHINTAVELANGTHWAQAVGGFVGEQILEQAAIGAAGTAIAGAGGAAAGGGAAACLPFLTPPCSIQ